MNVPAQCCTPEQQPNPEHVSQVSAALASNLGNSIDSTAIAALGNESTGLSLGQIKEMKPDDLIASLSALSSITGWNEGQAKAFILLLISSGKFEVSVLSLCVTEQEVKGNVSSGSHLLFCFAPDCRLGVTADAGLSGHRRSRLHDGQNQRFSADNGFSEPTVLDLLDVSSTDHSEYLRHTGMVISAAGNSATRWRLCITSSV